MDLKDIKAIIDLMKKNSISEFELERQEFKIKLKRGGNAIVTYDEPASGPGKNNDQHQSNTCNIHPAN